MINLCCRKAGLADVDLLYAWVNDPLVRKNSFQQAKINFEGHVKWFTKKLDSKDCYIYIFFDDEQAPVGQVRIDKDNNEVIIGLSIDERFRGMALGAALLNMACVAYFKANSAATIVAYIKEENTPSYKTFTKAGFTHAVKVLYHNHTSFRLIRIYEHF